MKTFLTALVVLWSSALLAQEDASIVVNRTFSDQPLTLAILTLKIDYGLEFEYDESELEGIRIEARIRRLPLDDALELLLRDTGLSHHLFGKTVVITRGGQSVIDQPEVVIEPTQIDLTVSGQVVEKESGETLPNALVLVKQVKGGTTTNLDGYFTLFNVPTDTSTLVISYLGYDRLELKLTPELASSEMIVELQSGATQLKEIVVQAQRDLMMEMSDNISQISISPAQISSLPSLGEKDIFRSLQLLPGVSATNESSAGLYVRGGTPDQNLVMFDGFTVYHVDHFYGFFSAFNANAIKDVQLYKGGFEAKYGGRISSVMELTGKTGNVNKLSGSVGLSALSANGTLEIPFASGKGSILLAGRRSYTDVIQTGLYNNINDLFNESNSPPNQGGPGGGRFLQSQTEPSFYFYDLNGKVSFKPSDKDVFSFSVYNGQDNLDNSREIDNTNFAGFGNAGANNNGGGSGFSFQNRTEDLARWGNWGVSSKWSRKWSNYFYSNAVVGYSNYFSRRDRFSLTEITRDDTTTTRQNGFVEDNDLKDITLRLDNELLLSQSNQLEFGVQLTYNDIAYSYQRNDTIVVLDRQDAGLQASLYLQDHWKPFAPLTVTLGGRATYYDVTGETYFEPRASLGYKITDRIRLKGAWGIYNQFATRIVREDITQGSRDFWLLADDVNNPISSATHYIAGISYETDELLFDVEAYYKDMSGLSEFSLRFTPARGNIQAEELFFEGVGTARGVELLVQRKFGKVTGWVGYTLSEVEHTFPELSDTPFPALHDQTHEFKLVTNYKVGRWDLAGTWVYGTGKPYTAPIGGYEITLLDGSTNSYVSVGEKNIFRLPDYHRLDLSATYNFYLGKATSSLGLSVFNLYNNTNVWYKEYEIVEDEIIETDINYLGFTPNLFFNVKF